MGPHLECEQCLRLCWPRRGRGWCWQTEPSVVPAECSGDWSVLLRDLHDISGCFLVLQVGIVKEEQLKVHGF